MASSRGAALILLLIIDVASAASACSLSSAVLEAIQKAPAGILALQKAGCVPGPGDRGRLGTM